MHRPRYFGFTAIWDAMQGKRKAQRILIAEEDRVEAGILAFHLRRAGYKPLRVVDQQEVADALEWGAPAAIIADLDSPGISGLALARSLEGSSLVFMLVANRPLTAAEELEALRLRIPSPLHKPIDPNELIERLGRSRSAVMGPPEGTPAGHIRGELGGRALADIIRLGSRHHVDAYLSLDAGEEDGWLLLHRGRIIDAAIGEHVAREAAIDLVVRDQGAFNLVPLEANDPILNRPDSVQCDLISLLARATATHHAMGASRDGAPPSSSVQTGIGSPAHPLSRVTLPDAVKPRPQSLAESDAKEAEGGAGWWKPTANNGPQPAVDSRTRRRAPRPRPGADDAQNATPGSSATLGPEDEAAVAASPPKAAQADALINPERVPSDPDEPNAKERGPEPDNIEGSADQTPASEDISSEDGEPDDEESSEIRGRLVPRSFFSGGRRPTRRPTRPRLAAAVASVAVGPESSADAGNDAAHAALETREPASPSDVERPDSVADDEQHSQEQTLEPAELEPPDSSLVDAAPETPPAASHEVPDDPGARASRITTAEWDTREYYFAGDDDDNDADEPEEQPVGQTFGGLTASPPTPSERPKKNLRPVILALSAVFVASFVYVVVQLVTGPSGTVPRPGKNSVATAASSFEQRLGSAQLALDRKDYGQARQLFEAAVDERATHVGARAGLAKSLFLSKRWTAARGAYEALAKLSPKDPRVYWHLVHVHAASGDIEAAERAVAAFEKLAPSNPERTSLRKSIERLR